MTNISFVNGRAALAHALALALMPACSDDATQPNANQGSGGTTHHAGTGGQHSAGTDPGGNGATGSGATASGGSSAGNKSGGSATGGTGGDTWVPFPLCVQSCDAPADCVTPGSVQHDADNYACDGGYCEYLGCQNNAECQTMGQNWVCDEGAFGLPICVRTCSSRSDCALAADPRFDDDNYACNDSKCEWLGCQSNTECQGMGLGDDWVCADGIGNVPTCVRTCNAAADCVYTNDARYDADNYACNDSLCEYVGCQSNAECELAGADWECVEK